MERTLGAPVRHPAAEVNMVRGYDLRLSFRHLATPILLDLAKCILPATRRAKMGLLAWPAGLDSRKLRPSLCSSGLDLDGTTNAVGAYSRFLTCCIRAAAVGATESISHPTRSSFSSASVNGSGRPDNTSVSPADNAN